MFPAPEILTAEVFARLPPSMHQTDKPSQWLADRHVKMHSFLEGPAFDREGNLWCVDLAHGRLLRVSVAGEFETALEYDGEPNGLRIHRDGRVGLAGPNGLVLDAAQKTLYVAVTRENAIFSLPLEPHYGGMRKAGRFIQLSGATGPDGLALDEAGNLVVVHAGAGTVWVFSRLGEPLYRIRSSAGSRTTNVAYGGDDRRFLYITEAEQGAILRVRLPVPGRLMYSHLDAEST